MNLRVFLLCAFVALLVGTPATAAPVGYSPGELPLGQPGLKETRAAQQLAPGVTYTRIVRGQQTKKDFYTVDVAFRGARTAAEEIAAQLEADGYDPVIVRVAERAPGDPKDGPLGYLVRAGRFATQAGADDLRAELTAKGYTGLRTVYTGEDGGKTRGPWVVHVLKVDPELFRGTLAPELATGIVPDRETLTSISARTHSLAATNGGYFVIGPEDGTPGDLAGISMLEGAPVSEAVDGRTDLILPKGDGTDADVGAISDEFAATSSDGATREIDGLNRKPGLIRVCGGEGGDVPTELPKHDFTCTDASELILFTPIFGTSTDSGEGAEAVLNASGRVVEVRDVRGGPIPDHGSVLSGTGDGARWLRAHARPGTKVRIKSNFSTDSAPLSGKTGIVNGGPRLLSGGSPDITAYAEGFVYTEEPEF
jgi:SPOR domain